MKRIKGCLIMLIAAFFIPTVVSANDLTLQDRINDASDGDTVALEDNFEGDYILISNKKITLDLGNYNINTTDYAAIYVYGGEVTIKGTGTIKSTSNNGIQAQNGAVVKVENVKIEGGYHGISVGNTNNLTSATVTVDNATIRSQEFGIAVFVDSTLTFNSGSITTADNCGIGGNGIASYIQEDGIKITINGGTITGNIQSAGYASCGMYLPQKSKTTITGGTITSTTGPGIVMRGGELTMTGGTINAQGAANLTGWVGDKKNQLAVSGIIMDQTTIGGYTDAPNMKVTVSGTATINGVKDSIECMPGDAGATCNITLQSGVYNSEPDATTIQEGYQVYEVLNVEDGEEKYVVASEDDISNEVISAPITKDDVEESDMTLLKSALEENLIVAGFYEILLTQTVGENIIGIIAENENKVDVTIGLPTNLKELKNGFKRKYVIIRVHEGKTDVITDVKDNGDGTITFKSDKFSTYMLAYEDVEETTETVTPPKTFDSIVISIISLISILGVICGYKKIKKYAT